MEFDLGKLPFDKAYTLLNGIVVPRPIAWITTLNADGQVNAAPYSAFNVLTHDPPMVAVGVSSYPDGRLKDTGLNIQRSGEFVVNMVDEQHTQAMVDCSVDFPPDVEELAQCGVPTAASEQVAVPRICGSPASLECRQHVTLSFGPIRKLVIGRVLHVAVRDDLVRDAERCYVATERMELVGRMQGPGWYTRTSQMFQVPRLSLEEWREKRDAVRGETRPGPSA